VRFNERVVLAGREIADDALADLLEECEAANEGREITFFEITSAAAFLAFARTDADILLMETGLGGRLDATNVVARPALTAITPISHDHARFLGDDLTDIAGEKAAILKPGVPAVIGPQPREAAQVIAARAGAVGAPLYRHHTDWQAVADETGMSFRGRRWTLDLPPPGLAGAHQIDNAGLAVACLENLDGAAPGFPLDAAAVGRGVGGPRWPGRLQRLRQGPLVDALPADWQLWLDGGHNGAAGEALAAMAETWRGRPLYLVAAMLESKDPSAFLGPLAPHATSLFAVPVPGAHAAYTPSELAAQARAAGIEARPAIAVEAALDGIAGEAGGPARVLICGSLYLAGAVLEHNS
jgi:dihydrofolate synthase/folylpolyglutamate synthase